MRLLELKKKTSEKGQAMVEYAIIAAGILVGVVVINSILVPALNTFYELIAFILSYPIP